MCRATHTTSNWFPDGKGGWLCKSCYMKDYFARRSREEYFIISPKRRIGLNNNNNLKDTLWACVGTLCAKSG